MEFSLHYSKTGKTRVMKTAYVFSISTYYIANLSDDFLVHSQELNYKVCKVGDFDILGSSMYGLSKFSWQNTKVMTLGLGSGDL